MQFIPPNIRYMLLCDEVLRLERQVSIINLMSSIQAPSFPHVIPDLSIYIGLTGGRGIARTRIRGIHVDTGESVFTSKTHDVHFVNRPLDILGFSLHIKKVRLPFPGLYIVECLMNDLVIAHQTLVLRELEDV